MRSPFILKLLADMSAPRLDALFAQDLERAAHWVRVAAAEGLPQAQLCYGRMLLEGTGVAKDLAEAFNCFRRAALHGDIDAVNMAGRCLDNGWGTAEDPAAAAALFECAARAGHAWAQYNLAHLYLDGRGVARDWPRAYRYYVEAAEQQHSRAMNLAGRCCEEGWGRPRCPAAAADWYRRSAEGGYFRGQYNWASILLQQGRSDEAALWLERAASGGTAAVRDAVRQLISRATAAGALQDLAGRLEAGQPDLKTAPACS